MRITKNTLTRALRTFLQTALGYVAVNIAVLDFSQTGTVLKAALTGLAVSAAAAGLAAVMNMEEVNG
jgi:hypothetical protein